MRGPRGSFGFVVLLVVVAVVLLLAARAWSSVASSSGEALRPSATGVVESHGESGAGEALRSGDLPDLGEMRANTDAHAEEVGEAMSETE